MFLVIFIILFVLLGIITVCAAFYVKRSLYKTQFINIKKLNHALLKFSEAGIFILDDSFNIVMANKKLEVLTGYSLDEICNQGKWKEFIDKDLLERMLVQKVAVSKTTKDFIKQFPTKIVTQDGDVKEILMKVIVLPQSKRTIVSLTDITLADKAGRQLEELKKLHDNTLKQLTVPLVRLNRDYEIVYMNDFAKELLGYSINETDKLLAFQDIILPYYWDKLEVKLRLLFLKDTVFKEEIDFVKKNKTSILCEISFTKLYLDEKNFELLGIIQDVSGLKDLENRMAKLEKMIGLGEYFIDISRDLNDKFLPKYSELKKLRDNIVPDDLERFDAVLSSFTEIEGIIKSFKLFTRDTAIKKDFFEINESALLAVGLASHIYSDYSLNISTNLAPNLPKAYADKILIEQVIINLLKNSYEAVDKRKGEISIKTYFDDKNIYIEVKDNGCGIKKEDLPKIFFPFFTTKNKKNALGVGLSSGYDIMRMHGGEIKADSVEGKGSNFTIILPLLKYDVSQKEITETKELKKDTGKKRLLLLEDDKMAVDLVRSIFEYEDNIEFFSSYGRESIDLISRNGFDVLLVDIGMPGMNGKEFYSWIQENKPEYIKKIIFFTGDRSLHIEDFIKVTGRKLIYKPFEIKKLMETINEVI